MNNGVKIFFAGSLMLLIGTGVGYWLAANQQQPSTAPSEPEILYWVAPMDDNYRRDKPGKSPMGMDLVPVYAQPEQAEPSEPEILYWVAPMDDNYRRDKPGKSPMGMDLVPVYADSTDQDEQPGTIVISAQVENNIGVRTAAVRYQPLQLQINTVGYIGYDQDKLSHFYPRVEGWIEALEVSAVGDHITKGQPLFSLYSPTLVNAQEEFLTALKRDNKAIIVSAKNRLLALGISSEQIKLLQKDKKVLQQVMIYAANSGYLTQLNVREGQYIQPHDNLMSMIDISSVWVMAEVFERQAGWLEYGLEASMTTEAIPGRVWQGRVEHIHPFLLEKTRTMRVRVDFANQDEALKPNMFVNVKVVNFTEQAVISVPRQAVIRTGRHDRVVLALGDGKYRSVEVVIGRESNQWLEIIDGLSSDDVVVTSAQFLLDSESNTAAEFERMNSIESQQPVDSPAEEAHHHHHEGHH